MKIRILNASLILLLPVLLLLLSGCFASKDYLIDRAGKYYIEGDLKRGVELLEQAVQKDSTNARAYYNLGNFNLQLGNFELAAASLKKAMELYPKYDQTSSASMVGKYPKYYEAIDNLALTFLLMGNFEDAIKLTDESSMPGYDNDQPLHTSFLAHILCGKKGKGMELFSKYTMLNPEKVQNDSLLVNLFNENKLTKNAFLSYLQAQFTTGSPEKGLQYLQPALDEQPANKIFTDLRDEYKDPQYMTKKSESAKAYNDYLRALNLVQQGYHKAADRIIDDVIKKEPENLSFLELQAVTKFELGDINTALTINKKIISIKPDFARSWYNLGNYYTRVDSLQLAEESFIKCLSLNPNYPEAHSYLAIISWKKDSDYKKAKAYFDKEFEINPKNESAYFNAGYICFLNKDYDESVKYLIQLLNLNPYDHVARARLIDTYVAKGDKNTAIAFTKSSLEFLKKEKAGNKVIIYFEKRNAELQANINTAPLDN